MRDPVLGGYVYTYFLCLPSQSFLLRSFLLVIPSLALTPYSVLCTRVYTVVYPRVHCCIHACTQRRSLLLRLGALFCSMDGLLVYSANGLSSARQKGSCQLGGWTPLSAMNGLVPALWIAFSLRRGGLLS